MAANASTYHTAEYGVNRAASVASDEKCTRQCGEMRNDPVRLKTTDPGRGLFGLGRSGTCPRGENYEQTQFQDDEFRRTSSHAGFQKNEIATAQPPLWGPSEVFRIVDEQPASTHETLPRNRFLLHRDTFGPQWAVPPKLTMIAGQQLSISFVGPQSANRGSEVK